VNETDLRRAAKKIQSAQTFRELHEIIMAYAKLYDFKEPGVDPNAPAFLKPPRDVDPGSFYNAYGFVKGPHFGPDGELR